MTAISSGRGRRRPPADCNEPSCAIAGQIKMLADGMTEIFPKLEDIKDGQADLRVRAERREAQAEAMTEKLDRHMAEGRAHHEDHETRLKAVEEHMTLFAAARRIGSLISAAIGFAVTGLVLAGCAWVIKKVTGIDVSHFLRIGE